MRFSILFVISLFLISQFYSYSVEAIAIEKPWTNTQWVKDSPFIVNTAWGDEWDTAAYDTSLDSLKLGDIDTAFIKSDYVKTKVKNAKINVTEAKAKSAQCIAIENSMKNAYYYSNFSALLDDCIKKKISERLFTLWGTTSTVLMPWTVGFDPFGCAWDAHINDENFKSSLQANQTTSLYALTDCSAKYSQHWKTAMSASTDALTESLYQADLEWEKARQGYEKLEYAGICDSGYDGSGKEQCTELKDTFNAIDANLKTGKGGSYVKARADALAFNKWITGAVVEDLTAEECAKIVKDDYGVVVSQDIAEKYITALYEYVPQTGGYSPLMTSIWKNDGVIAAADAIKTDATNALTDANIQYTAKRGLTTAESNSLNKEFADAETEKLSSIIDAVYLKDTLAVGEGQKISDRFNSMKTDKQAIETELAVADAIYAGKGKDYLKNASDRLNNANTKISNTRKSLGRLINDSKSVVAAKQAEAQAELTAFESLTSGAMLTEDTQKFYDDAKIAIEKGDKIDASTKLGDRFTYYSSAIKNLKDAAVSFNENPAEKTTAIKAHISRLNKLVSAAEADGIEVSMEKSLLVLFSQNEAAWIPGSIDEKLTAMEQGIIEKSKVRWGFLEQRRKQLLEKIALGGTELADLKTSMELAEKGAFDDDGSIRWPDAIGRLKQIDAAYTEIEGQITEKEWAMLTANGLIVNKALFISDVELDKPAEVSLDVFIKNRRGYGAKDVTVKLENDLQLLENNIVKGADLLNGMAQAGSTLTLYLKEVKPYSTYEILFNKNTVIAHQTKSETEAHGNHDGSASMDERIEFTLDYGAGSFIAPGDGNSDAESGSSTKIDGLPYPHSLEKGKHTMTRTYSISDAYSYEKTNQNVKKDFLKTTVQYDLLLTPHYELEDILFFVEKPDDAKDFAVSSLGWEKLKEKTELGNGLYSFKVTNLKKDGQASIRVSYSIDNATAYLTKELAAIDSSGLSDSGKAIYLEAQAAAAVNNTNEALAKIEKLKALVEKEKADKAKATAAYDKLTYPLEKEQERINQVLAELKSAGIEDAAVGLLEARAEVLNETLEEAEQKSPAEAVELLKAVDKTWMKKELAPIKKRLFEGYTAAKKKIIDMGAEDVNMLSTQFSEFERAYAKLEASGDVRDLSNLLIAYKAMNDAVKNKESQTTTMRGVVAVKFDSLKANLTKMLAKYSKENKAAQGTQFISLLSIDEKFVDGHIKSMEDALKKGKSITELDSLLAAIERDGKTLSATLSVIAEEARQTIEATDAIFKSKPGISDANKQKINQYIETAKAALANKDYISSLKASEKAISLIQNQAEGDDKGMLLLGLTALFIIGAIMIYIIKHVKKSNSLEYPGGFKIGGIKFGGSGKSGKQYKKLARAKG